MIKTSRQKALSVAFLYDDTLDSTDGVAQYVKTLGKWLSEQGHEVSYLVGETKIKKWAGGQVYSLARNQTVNFNRNRLSIPLPADRRRISKLLAEQHFDVLHVQVPYSPFMARYVINAMPAHTAIVGTFHIYPSSLLVTVGSRLLKVLLGRSLKKFDNMTAVSKPAADFASQTFGIHSEVAPNMVDLSHYRPNGGTSNIQQSKELLFLGRLVERKGCLQLLRAFKLLSEDITNSRLTIAGDGPMRGRLEAYIQQNNLKDKVSFTGYVSESEKPALLARADVACFPSLFGESFGIVLLEAMAAGSGVVVGGNNPGYSSVLQKRSEVLVDPNSTVSFASKLRAILTDRRLSNALHKWQQDLVLQYDVNVVGVKIVDIYRRAIAKKHKN